MDKQQSELVRLSETAKDLADFLEKACALLNISFRQVSLRVGLSHAAVWNLVSGHTKRGKDETIAKLALFFGVPEANLRTLAGFGPQRISPTYGLGRAEAIYQLLTDEEKNKWIEYGELLLKARSAEFQSPGEK